MSEVLNLSGNQITQFPDATHGRQDFATTGPYRMYQIHLGAGESHSVDLAAFTVLVLSGSVEDDCGSRLGPHDGINVVAKPVQLTAMSDAKMIVSGVTEAVNAAPSVTFVAAADQYRVDKPWGHELWFSGPKNPYYALKEVFIRAGTRTSLQYHNFKHEANVIFGGTAQLVYQKNLSVPIDDVTTADLGEHDIQALAVINITPRVLHRIYAKTDVMIYETSTPHLDDVVRVSDDAGRRDGRVESEHQKLAS